MTKGKKKMCSYESYLAAGTTVALEVAWQIIKEKLKDKSKLNDERNKRYGSCK